MLAVDPGSPGLQEPVEGRAALGPASFLGVIVCFIKPRQTGTSANWIYVPFDVEMLWVGSRYPRAAQLALAERMSWAACQLDPFTPLGAPGRWAQKEASSLRGATVMKPPSWGLRTTRVHCGPALGLPQPGIGVTGLRRDVGRCSSRGDGRVRCLAFLSFQSRSPRIPWLVAPSSTYSPASSGLCSALSPLPPSRKDPWDFTWATWIIQETVPIFRPGFNPSAESLCAYKATCPVLGVRTGMSIGDTTQPSQLACLALVTHAG